MFIAALFIIARTRKQPRCPSADEWIRKLWYIYTMEYYSAIKDNTFESVLMRWMKLEPIIQSEVSQKEKHQYSKWNLRVFSFSYRWIQRLKLLHLLILFYESWLHSQTGYLPKGFPCGLAGKESACSAGQPGSSEDDDELLWFSSPESISNLLPPLKLDGRSQWRLGDLITVLPSICHLLWWVGLCSRLVLKLGW